MSEILSHGTTTRIFVGRRVKDLTGEQLEQVNLSKVNHIDVGNDMYLGFYVEDPHAFEGVLLEVTKQTFREVCRGLEPSVFHVHSTTIVERISKVSE